MGEKQKAQEKRKEKKVGENNGQLRFVRHHRQRTQARLDQYPQMTWCGAFASSEFKACKLAAYGSLILIIILLVQAT